MKKFILVLLILALCIPVSALENKVSEWAEPEVNQAYEVGIIPNSLNGDFTQNITREEFCELAYELILKIEGNGFANGDIECAFQDTDNPKIIALWSIGIIKGESDTEFLPNNFITREEAVTILDRIAVYTDMYIPALTEPLYSDFDEISEWASYSASQMLSAKIMTGVGDNLFAPQEYYTREQAISTMLRLYNSIISTASSRSFSFRICEYMDTQQNWFISPFSVKVALAMAANGAENKTREEILKTLGVDSLENFNNSMMEFIETYSSSDNQSLSLKMANSIWLNKDRAPDINFSETFVSEMAKYYKAKSSVVDNNNAVESINNWTSENTNGKITSITDNNEFDALLVNTVYFNGAWQNQFDSANTAKGNFTDKNGKVTQIDFMNQNGNYRYFENPSNGLKMIELTYKNDTDKNISMYIALSDNYSAVEEAISNGEFVNCNVNVSIPKFKTETSLSLVETLKLMGINDAFNEIADFTKMFSGGNMYISDVLHKTYISVDENGTEAAAATSVEMKATSAIQTEVKEFKADKPFIYVIRDNNSGNILFIGHFSYIN